MWSEETSEVIQTWPTLKPTTISGAQHLILSPEPPELYTNCAIFLTVSWSFSTPDCHARGHARGQDCTLRLRQLHSLTASLSPLPSKSPPCFATSFHASNKTVDSVCILSRSTAGLSNSVLCPTIRTLERHADRVPEALHFS